jgi:hypothetical protein
MPAPDEWVDANKFHVTDVQRAALRDKRAEARMLTRIRLILRRIRGRKTG